MAVPVQEWMMTCMKSSQSWLSIPNLLCHTQLQDSSPSIMIPLNIKGDSVPIQDITLNLISLISTVCGNLS